MPITVDAMRDFVRRRTDTQSHKAWDVISHLHERRINGVSVSEIAAASGATEKVVRNVIRRSRGTLTVDDNGVLQFSHNGITLSPAGGSDTEHGTGLHGRHHKSLKWGKTSRILSKNNGPR